MAGHKKFQTEYCNFDNLYNIFTRLLLRTKLNDSYHDNKKLLQKYWVIFKRKVHKFNVPAYDVLK